MSKVIEDIRDFYIRNDIESLDPDQILDIWISLDGAYQRRGFESTYCISFAIECWTNRPIDFNISIKCFSCPDCEVFSSNCKYGLYHGPSGNMEITNAIALFDRSVEIHKLRYLHYVADGECKIYPYLVNHDPYPNYDIIKHECANHLGKRANKALCQWGTNWTEAKGREFIENKKKN